ncbi:glycosyltransferase family 4 protein [Leucobacter ruminantium]|uniref:Glycosyltransferase family 4 protein n=1 Tax=Leucobacter ruminantium TaxID=1289170 RepID=A0A939LVI5_9MICO|nr:glycosyltransferase family 4 protein [Leucobacter ruminantium]MBO1805549.1 glycosyltransferase family 4 protein [Leucobacter ruminantium]
MTAGNRRPQVLVLTPDTLGEKMAGPAIRAFEIAKALHRVAEVRLVSTVGNSLQAQAFPVEHAGEHLLRQIVSTSDVIVVQGHLLSQFPWIAEGDAILVADIYDPMQLEILEHGKEFPPLERIEHSRNTVDALSAQIERADFMICASEKQRDLWLGHLGALCRINPYTYDNDQSLRSLIDVVPFGIQDQDPIQRRHAIKGTVPGISSEDKVIIWGGGVYNWFDPLTLIRAVALLAPRRPDLRLFFLGVQHPNPHVPAMRMAADAMALADELGIRDRHVFFNQEWVKYEERADYLLDADLGVSTHFDHVETAFSFRTRILDYLWAELPIISTAGDTFAQVIAESELGEIVEPEDEAALADAIERAVYDGGLNGRYRENVRRYRTKMTWSRVLAPLVSFCENPQHAPDFGKGIIPPRETHRAELQQRLDEIEHSTAWKATANIRSVLGALKSIVRRR